MDNYKRENVEKVKKMSTFLRNLLIPYNTILANFHFSNQRKYSKRLFKNEKKKRKSRLTVIFLRLIAISTITSLSRGKTRETERRKKESGIRGSHTWPENRREATSP